MFGPQRYLYDIPVYRLPEEQYYRELNEYIDGVLVPIGTPNREAMIEELRQDPEKDVSFRDHMVRSYGGMWRYNEIVAYIRLHFLGSQVRGEYYAVNKKRMVRTRRKVLEFSTWKLAPEQEIWDSSSSESIYSVLLEYINDCRKELPRRYIDSSVFEEIGPYVDWKSIFDES
jgi:hypothetical protein